MIQYDSSLLALTASVLQHYGAKTEHKTLPCLDALLAKDYSNVIVMLFDGMGTKALESHLPPNSLLRRNLCRTISSVFPPTTTAATITMETGLSPIQHGWLGWSLYFDEIQANVDIFPNTVSGSGGQPAAGHHMARTHLPYKSIFKKIEEATGGAVYAASVSPFSKHRVQSVTELCGQVKELCHQAGKKYIYTYWPQPDSDMHMLGTMHGQVKSQIGHINDQVEQLCAGLTDALVIVTADHGLVDTQWRFLADYPEVESCLARSPSIESRAMSFFIRPHMHAQFETAFQKHFGDCYRLLTKSQVQEVQLFGAGQPHSRTADFIGDCLAIATGSISIESDPIALHHAFKAAHAGLTEAEMSVPLIAVACR